MYKKSLICRLRGDSDLAEDWSKRYLAVYKEHFAAMNDDELDAGEGTVEDILD